MGNIANLQIGAATGDVIGATQGKTTLEPNVFQREQMKDKVQEVLTQIAFKFIKSWDLNNDITIKDIILTGSTAGYNWTKGSDIDLHIVLDLNEVHQNRDIVAKYLNALATLWNAKHKISIFNHPVELYVQDANEPHVSPGIYSLVNQNWIQPPKQEAPIQDTDKLYALASKYNNCLNYLEALYNQGKFEEVYNLAEQFRAYLKYKRASGLYDQGGLNSIENLIFKVLRKGGVLERLSQLQTAAYDNMNTLQQEVAPTELHELVEVLSNPETGYVSKSPDRKRKIAQAIKDVLANRESADVARKSLVEYFNKHQILKAGLKSIIYDLTEYDALEELAEVIAQDKLMPFDQLGQSGNLVDRFHNHYCDYPNLKNKQLLEALTAITGAFKTVNIGRGELAITLLCKEVEASQNADGDLKVGGLLLEVKGSDARAMSQKSGYRENSDKVIMEALKKRFGVQVPAMTSGRFAQKLGAAFKLHLESGTNKDYLATEFAESLQDWFVKVYRGIKTPKFLTEEDKPFNSKYITKINEAYEFNSTQLEQDLAKVLLEDYIDHHNFDKWFFFNTKTYDYMLCERKEVLDLVSVDKGAKLFVYMRDGTVRVTYNRPTKTIQELLEEGAGKVVYHYSFKSDPSQLTYSETIKDAALAAAHQSKTGFLGTGLYVFGNPDSTQGTIGGKDYADFMQSRSDKNKVNTFAMNVDGLNLFRPDNPEEFVSDIRVTTINIYHLTGQDLKEEIVEAAQELTRHIKANPKEIAKVLAGFAKDIKNPAAAKEPTQLTNRLLAKYDGIDLTGTTKDHFGTGSVIFPKAIPKVTAQTQIMN